jgi:uncharacterized protein (TIGR03118 family)
VESYHGLPLHGEPDNSAGDFHIRHRDGTISAWNPTVDPIIGGKSTATLVVDNSGKGAVYKGLAFATNKHGNFLFATNFATGAVEVYDKNFAPATLDGKFSDPEIPSGFAPFGIANIDNNLYVTYAKQNRRRTMSFPEQGSASSTYSAPTVF